VKPIVYVDMDGVLVDFVSGIDKLVERGETMPEGGWDEHADIFPLMDPFPGAIDAINELSQDFELYVLSTSPWNNPNAASDKVAWIKKHFGSEAGSIFYKRVILSHAKHLNAGDFLIDDKDQSHLDLREFKGEYIHFASDVFPDWPTVVDHLTRRLQAK